MSLWINVRNVKDGDRELGLYTSAGKYNLKYETGNQKINLKSNIEDKGYANYLFDKFLEDLHMKESLIEDEDYYDVDYFKERIDKFNKDLMKNKSSNSRAAKNRKSSDVVKLIRLQSKITEILLKDKGEFEIADCVLNEFIDNQKHIRRCIGENEYSKTSYGVRLNQYLRSIDNLNMEKLKHSDCETIKLFESEIERMSKTLRREVEILLKL